MSSALIADSPGRNPKLTGRKSASKIGSNTIFAAAMVRYADDFVVVCATRERAEAARDLAAATLARVGLRLDPDKTSIRDIRNGDDGFDFLGFHHHMVRSFKQPNTRYLARWPSDRAMRSIRARLRDMTDRRHVGLELAVIVKRMNLTLTGWGNYFQWGNSHDKFTAMIPTLIAGWPRGCRTNTHNEAVAGHAATTMPGVAAPGSYGSLRCDP